MCVLFLVIVPFLLAGEPVRFHGGSTPQFTDNQIRNSAEATRAGLEMWASTEQGRKLIAYFSSREFRITIIEDSSETGAGRAPQPGLATLVAASDHSRTKSYDLILNPTFFKLPNGMEPLPNQPATAADVMAIAWAGEMLHIYFYAHGISLPHHPRSDFQEQWHTIAAELGMPAVRHDDDDEVPHAARLRFIGR
jgi:hypothetical protein